MAQAFLDCANVVASLKQVCDPAISGINSGVVERAWYRQGCTVE